MTKIRLTSSLENFRSSNPSYSYKTIFPAWECAFPRKKRSLRPGNAKLQKRRALERHCHAFPPTLTRVDDHSGEIICYLLQVASKCSAVQSSVAVYSDPHLMLFVQLKSLSLLSIQSPASSLSSSSVTAHTSQPQAVELLHQVSEADKCIKHVTLPKNCGNDNADVDGGDDEANQTTEEAVIDEIMTLLQQWLPVHSLPDDVEVVKKIPFTKHGRFPSSYYRRRHHHHHPGWPLILESS